MAYAKKTWIYTNMGQVYSSQTLWFVQRDVISIAYSDCRRVQVIDLSLRHLLLLLLKLLLLNSVRCALRRPAVPRACPLRTCALVRELWRRVYVTRTGCPICHADITFITRLYRWRERLFLAMQVDMNSCVFLYSVIFALRTVGLGDIFYCCLFWHSEGRRKYVRGLILGRTRKSDLDILLTSAVDFTVVKKCQMWLRFSTAFGSPGSRNGAMYVKSETNSETIDEWCSKFVECVLNSVNNS